MGVPSPDSLYRQLLHVCRFLERGQTPYMVVGGIAVGVWSAPRATVDLDFVVGVPEETRAAFVQSAVMAGLVVFDPEPIELRAVKFLRMQMREPESRLLTLDFILADDEYKKAALDRAVPIRLEDQEVRIAAPEDVILLKLMAGRGQDLIDAENVVRARRESLDLGHLRHWAGRLSLADPLNKLLAQSGAG